jgi:hypothetical protein
MHDPDALKQFSSATQAQLGLSKKVTKQLASGTLDDLKAAVEQCLDRTSGWVRASRNALVGIQYGEGRVSEASQFARKAFDLATLRRFTEAVQAQQIAINATSAKRERGWLKQQQVAYLHPIDAVRAQNAQTKALDDNRTLLRSQQTMPYVRITGKVQKQAEAASEFMSRQYAKGEDLLIGFNALLGDLEYDPDPGRVEDFEQGVADLGAHLGFVTQRPERDFKKGPDDLWALGENKYLVIECKSGVVTDFIRKKDADQLSGSMNWFRTEYGDGDSATPLMFHQVNLLDSAAAAPQGMQIITNEGLQTLIKAIRTWAASLAFEDSFKNPEKVGQLLLKHQLNGGGSLLTRARVPVS